jgi:hypothetical protein
MTETTSASAIASTPPTDDLTAGTQAPSAPAVDFGQEASVGPWDLAAVGVVVLVAGIYLWRTYFGRRRSACAGCGKAKACPVSASTQEAPRA